MDKEEIKFEIKTEHIQALLEGKKLTLDIQGKPRITLIPDRYGVFLTMDKFQKLKSTVAMNLIHGDPEEIFRAALGDDLFERIYKNEDDQNPFRKI